MAKKVNLNAACQRNGILNDASLALVSSERITLLNHDDIIPQTEINSKIYDVKQIESLAVDISKRGIQSPLKVTPRGDGKYSLISGHRRYAANEMAISQYGYEKGEQVPCKVVQNCADAVIMKEDMILDNLQRDKTDYERMMEVVEFKACTEERRIRGEEIQNVREYISTRLGISISDIQRLLKIADSLCDAIKAKFRDELISTNVAHELARLDSETQEFVFSNWNWENVLTLPDLQNTMLTKLKAISSPIATPTPTPTRSKKIEFPPVTTIGEGISRMDETYQNIAGILRNAEPKVNTQMQKALIKRINKQMVSLLTLQQELEGFMKGE